ncbi:MAG: AmmeMemoRadiSam system protein B [Bacteroidetes bacterium]|nr:AmmeMemoRadiSam system protein B [Bacteroidota bacterium]
MRKIFSFLWLSTGILFFMPGCRCQNSVQNPELIDRPEAAAGKFYPADAETLRKMVESLFANAKPQRIEHVMAIICPHAGYEYSGIVAATSINQVDPDKEFENIFIIGSSHYTQFMGASIYNKGNYITPLGKVQVNIDLANKLIRDNPVFTFNPEADKNEHSLEVQVPLLQYHLKKKFRIVPIVLGTQSTQSCKKIAHALKPYLNEKNLFVFSTDFSHYPPYQDAIVIDKKSCDGVVSNSPDNLLKVLDENEKSGVRNLATSMCGWTSILTLLYMTENDPDITISPIYYRNSGDSRFADKSQVVGYWSIAISRNTTTVQNKSSEFNLSKNEKKELLSIARKTIEQYIRNHKSPSIDTIGFSSNLKMKSGAFVTLKEKGELRGCIGRFTSDEPLYVVIEEMAIASSTQDSRFPPVDVKEIDKIEIEISVLSPMKKINSIDEIVMGKNGIYIKKGYLSGTFLPQVATETGWSKEDFLGHCARDKAGIGWNGWKDAEIYIYEAEVFSEQEINGHKD